MVIKRDGTTEDFMPEKIVVSCVKAGATPNVAREIAKAVEKKVGERLSSSQIRKTVLGLLKKRKPEWERNWRVYDVAVKRRR